jgi:hypothetical protein
MAVWDQPWAKIQDPIQKVTKTKKGCGVAQVVACLQHKALHHQRKNQKNKLPGHMYHGFVFILLFYDTWGTEPRTH